MLQPSARLLYLWSTPKHYIATALLIIDAHKVQVLAERQSIVGDTVVDAGTVQTEMEIITSSKVIDRVINQLHLTEDPEFTGHSAGLFERLRGMVFGRSERPETLTQDELHRIAAAQFASNLIVARLARLMSSRLVLDPSIRTKP